MAEDNSETSSNSISETSSKSNRLQNNNSELKLEGSKKKKEEIQIPLVSHVNYPQTHNLTEGNESDSDSERSSLSSNDENKKSSHVDGTVSTRHSIVTCRPTDILCGRGIPIQLYAGNSRLHELVNGARERYQQTKRQNKANIIREIVQKAKAEGSRFLRRLESHENSNGDEDAWVEVDDEFAYQKVSHALRNQKYRIERQEKRMQQEQNIRQHQFNQNQQTTSQVPDNNTQFVQSPIPSANLLQNLSGFTSAQAPTSQQSMALPQNIAALLPSLIGSNSIASQIRQPPTPPANTSQNLLLALLANQQVASRSTATASPLGPQTSQSNPLQNVLMGLLLGQNVSETTTTTGGQDRVVSNLLSILQQGQQHPQASAAAAAPAFPFSVPSHQGAQDILPNPQSNPLILALLSQALGMPTTNMGNSSGNSSQDRPPLR